MLQSIVRWCVERRVPLVALGLFVLAGGAFVVPRLPIDAVPDVTNVQVVVLTEAPGLSAEEVERFVTFPLEMAMTGLPNTDELRSVTRGGLSAVTIVFDEDIDVWFARQLVGERLRSVEGSIPPGIAPPTLAPVSTGLGEIYQFVLKSDRHSSMALRDLLEWEITPKLRTVPGVIEVNAMGGTAKEYQVVLDPRRMAAHRIDLQRVLVALERNNLSVGGGWIERGPEALSIRGDAQLRGVEEIGAVVVATDEDGTPVLVRNLGEARIGAALPYGVVTENGRGEAVTGVVMMLIGQNSRQVVQDVKAAMVNIERTLPEGVRVEVVYDRASFIDRTLRTVTVNLVEGALLVGLVILVLLGSWRAAVLVTLGIPFSMVFAVAGMIALGIDGSLMSLGAIDFGLLVDGPIVMAEAVIARLALGDVQPGTTARSAIADALGRVARPVVFSVMIILLVYLPLLSLEGSEGKMFRPMAATMALALAGSVIYSLFIFPAGVAMFLRPPKRGSHGHGAIFARVEGWYSRALRWAIARRVPLFLAACIPLTLSFSVALELGADFVPRIQEGDIVVAVRRIPSIGLGEARRLDLEVQRVVARYPEVVSQIAQTGRSEVATDPVGMDNTDILVRLKPPEQWSTARDLDGLSEVLKTAIEREVPSTFVSISQPIEDRTSEILSGSRADVAILLFGENLNVMTSLARRVMRTIRGVAGAGDVRMERALGLPMLEVRADRAKLARHGMRAEDVLATVEASRQGRRVGFVYEGQKRYDLRVLLPPASPTIEGLAALPVGLDEGHFVPLGQVASVHDVDGPAQISRKALQRRVRVEVNIRGRDLVGFVNEARAAVEREVPMPEGHRLEWGGQFENLSRASERLAVVVPLALVIIFGMLMLAFGDARYALAVFSSVPFALVGGVLALGARGMPFSIPAAVGFIALCGIAVLNGVVMASEIRTRIDAGTPLDEAVHGGAVAVLRAMILTAMVAAIGFFPMAISQSAGSEVQRPLATAVIGGIGSSSLLGLFLLPGLLRSFLGARAARPSRENIP